MNKTNCNRAMDNIPTFSKLAEAKQKGANDRLAARQREGVESNENCNAKILHAAKSLDSSCFCSLSTTSAYRDALVAKGYKVEEERETIYTSDGDPTKETMAIGYKVTW